MGDGNQGNPGNLFLLNFLRAGAAGATAALVSLYAALAVPCAFLGFCALASYFYPMDGHKSKNALGSYIVTNMFLYNLFMILAFEDFNDV